MTPALTPLALPVSELGWPRRVAVLAGVAVATAGWAYQGMRHTPGSLVLAVFFMPLALSAVLVNLNHVGAQIVARGLWWFNLGGCTLIALTSRDAEPATIAFGAGVALLAAGGAGLGAGGPSRGALAPIALRRPLLVSIGMSVAEVQTLAAGAVLLAPFEEPPLAPQLAAAAVLLTVAVVGLYRLRAWGVFLHLVATAVVGRIAFNAAMTADTPNVLAASLWLGAVALQLAVPMPMVWALVRRRPVAPPSTSPTAPRLFAALVVALMLAAVYGGIVAPRAPWPG